MPPAGWQAAPSVGPRLARPIGFGGFGGRSCRFRAGRPVIVVGKVGKFEEKEQEAHRIAVIKIEDCVKGMKGLTSVRVGTPVNADQGGPGGPPNIAIPNNGGGLARPAIWRVPAPALTEGLEGVFFLKKHDKGDFYVLVNPYSSIVPKTQPNYEEQVKLIKDVAKFVETPLEKGLTAEKAEDRLLAVGLLIMQYRTRKDSRSHEGRGDRRRASKQIMKVLAGRTSTS